VYPVFLQAEDRASRQIAQGFNAKNYDPIPSLLRKYSGESAR